MDKLKRHRFIHPFLLPVDPVALRIPDYFTIIREPMDISTLDKNLKNHVYSSYAEFEKDVRKIWENALRYNPQTSQIHQMTLEIKQYFESVNNEIKFSDNKNLRDRVHTNDKKHSQYASKPYFNHNNKYNKNASYKHTVNDQPLTYQEKKNLSTMIRSLETEHLLGVWEIVSEGNDQLRDNQIEFDIETLPVKKARELERYVVNKLELAKKKKNKFNQPVSENIQPALNPNQHPIATTTQQPEKSQDLASNINPNTIDNSDKLTPINTNINPASTNQFLEDGKNSLIYLIIQKKLIIIRVVLM